MPGGALPAISPVTGRTVLAELVDRYGGLTAGPALHPDAQQPAGLALHPDAQRPRLAPAEAALGFLRDYARVLLPPVLRLAARYGIGLEAHLQNCLPTFINGVPTRMAFRDFAGLRVYLPRLPYEVPLWPGSVVGTDDASVMLAKVGYTAFQAHLGELVIRLGESHGLDEQAAWRVVRAVVDETLGGTPEHAFFTAPTMPHKALVRMRLAGGGDVYLPVQNPLHDP